tara:strand:+ start:3373 stop:5388 length:2016 start_codon:yes stop_codon:yes gene_type:complete
MKYINSFFIVLFILIPSPTEYIFNSFPLNYVNLLLITIIVLNFKKLLKNTFHVALIFCLIKLVIFLVFSSNSYVCFNDNNVEDAQSSQFKVSESKCKSSFNEPNSNLKLYSEKIVEINNFQVLNNNQSIQNTTWNLGFVNDKKYNYFREYEQSQLWFPVEANYYIENSNLNYSIINVKYSGELIIFQDDLEIFNGNSYNFVSEELVIVNSTKDINIDYKFKSFSNPTTLPGYAYATLVISDQSSSLLRLINNFETLVFIELILFLLFLYLCIFKDLNKNLNNTTYLLLFLSILIHQTRISTSTVVILVFIFIYLCTPRSYLNKTNDFLFSFIIASLSFFKFFPLSDTIYQRGGTDGLRYESHARDIFVSGNLQGGEDLFTSQPGSRYLLYILKNIFGENDILQKIFILSIVYFCIITLKNKFYSLEITLISFLGLVYVVSSPIVLLISESLSETFAWPLIALLFIIYAQDQRHSKAIFLLSGLVVFIRLNYLPAIFIFLILFRKRNLVKIKDLYIFILILLLPLFHNLYFGKSFQLWVRSIDAESNMRIDVNNLMPSISNNLQIIIGDFSNDVIRSYVSLRFLFLQYLLILVFIVSILLTIKKINMEKLLIIIIPILFLAPHLFFDGLTEYPKHLVAGYTSITFVTLILNKETKFFSKLKLNRARYKQLSI